MTSYVYQLEAYVRVEVEAENEAAAFATAELMQGMQFPPITVATPACVAWAKAYDDTDIDLIEVDGQDPDDDDSEHDDDCITRCPYAPEACHIMHGCDKCAEGE